MVWKDGSVDWVPLKDLKQSNSVEIAGFVVTDEIIDEPDFNWWVRVNFSHKDRIISKVKYKYWRTPHKFWRLTNKAKEIYDIDRESGDNLWTTAN